MLVPRRGCGGSASCVYRGGKGGDQRSFGSASAGGKVGSVNGRMGARNENQQQERKEKQSLDMYLMSDGLHCICSSDKCPMMKLAGWFFWTEPKMSHMPAGGEAQGALVRFHRLGNTDTTLVSFVAPTNRTGHTGSHLHRRTNWADLYFKKIMKASFRGPGLSREESNYTSLSG